MQHRTLTPEILDSLAHDHADAVAARRDLRLINCIMGNQRWMLRELLRRIRPGDTVSELGAGDGSFASMTASRLPNVSFTGYDLNPAPADLPSNWRWQQGDFLADPESVLSGADVVLANLILHHFSDEDLARLGKRISSARLLLFSEPSRRSLHLWQGKMLFLLGINRVTRHDLPVSIRAGFRGEELPAALGLDSRVWRWKIRHTWRGACTMVAERIF